MDIFEQAKKFDADYYDQHTGYIYKIQEYNHRKRMGIPAIGIEVYDFEGNCIGTILEEEGD